MCNTRVVYCTGRKSQNISPSTLYIEVDHAGGEVSAVRVGGQVVLVAEGEVRF